LAEINFVDGQTLAPTTFGQYNEFGVWSPRKYGGSYGTNGFYLPFNDPTSATTLCYDRQLGYTDTSKNNWTPNNISVTAGTTYDAMTDVPPPSTIQNVAAGNYAVLNPLAKGTSQTNIINGNLYAIPTSGASNWGTVFSSIAIPTSGKWYIEGTAQVYAGSGNSSSLGVVDSATFIPTNTNVLFQYTTGEGFDGILAHLFNNYVSPISDGVQGTNVTGLTASSINLMLALDVTNGKVYAGYNGIWLNSGNPAAGTGEIASRIFSATDVVAGHTSYNGTDDQSQYFNFGQQPFSYTPPSGFLPLNSNNLPMPTIPNGAKVMAATTYTGNGSSQTITQTSANSGNNPLPTTFKPDLIWIKDRSNARVHNIQDSVRGVRKWLESNSANAEGDSGSIVTAFNANGFSISDALQVNSNTETYVSWQWNAGSGTTSSNTDGSITSTVSVNKSAGFSIVTYTGNGTTGATIGHGLGVAPSFMMVKSRDTQTVNSAWCCYHISLGNTKFLYLNTTDAAITDTNWNNTTPTSTVFTVNNYQVVNTSAKNYVAYCWTPIAGYSSFGVYTGNGSVSNDGPFIYTGFRPRWVMIKATTNISGNWVIIDTSRLTYNQNGTALYANVANSEVTTVYIDTLSNGFKIRNNSTNLNNSASDTYVYACFAENPFKMALSV
jgi:hypothetical protein